jgi:prepilin-type N-terminal cleavage/methylation domain-containing protein
MIENKAITPPSSRQSDFTLIDHRALRGFTLIELSIVLVIIGLIIGGVLVGRDLIRAAEIRALYGEYTQLTTAMNAFKIKYNCVAGDCPRATDFFGTDPEGCGVAAPDKTSAKMETCNGNGNNKIGEDGATENESLILWQHLSAARLWPGMYRGAIRFDIIPTFLDGTVLPQIKVAKNAGWYITNDASVWRLGAVPYTGNFVSTFAYNLFNYSLTEGIISPIEARALDTKYDDGAPATGLIQTPNSSYVSNCTNLSAPNTSGAAVYLNVESKNCILMFLRPGF